ncbi:FadR/GntR family transcriptional regulator [Caldinitratiruptor microaerophilus]|uniref:GntR family transcriptional regulator n=1 Tax=Caldinitratiruptor microaerophilus TaxID=671077 RepID=A0AA35CK16_9FIRM|nr:FCD domain-containing protein [Caldinitratiruptor microaerophilus]BDG59818.1 GntR family transcriptional regulator [Caldinitratiruptor microaerophilus]
MSLDSASRHPEPAFLAQSRSRRRPLHQSQLLADQLREHIAAAALPEGARLPSERELMQATGYSRATVREALRLLADQGLVRTRPGPNGGVFVARPGPDRLAHSLGILLEASHVDLAQLLEARVELESAAARLAAARITDDELRALRESCGRFAAAVERADLDACVEENLEFHVRVVAASHNEVLVLLHDAIRELVRVSTRDPVYSLEVQRQVVRAHDRIVDALEARDAEAAARRVRKHLAAFEVYLQQTNQYELLRRRFRL